MIDGLTLEEYLPPEDFRNASGADAKTTTAA
jgi:hypothetical protein